MQKINTNNNNNENNLTIANETVIIANANESSVKSRLYNKNFRKPFLSSNKKKFNVPKININDSDDNVIYTSETNENKVKSNSNSSKINKIEKVEEEDDILMNPPESRVGRFLSLSVDDASILLGKYSSLHSDINEETEFSLETEPLPKLRAENSSVDIHSIKPNQVRATPIQENSAKPRSRPEDDKNKLNKLRSYHGGNNLPQDVKAEIIKSILTDYNVEYYVNKFTSRDISLVKLDQQYIKFIFVSFYLLD